MKIWLLSPFLICLISYIHLAIFQKQIFLFNTVIHENGRLTLLGSLFYFEHFLGQIPQNIVLSFFLAGLLNHIYIPTKTRLQNTSQELKLGKYLLSIALLLFVLAIGVSWIREGYEMMVKILFQYKENDKIYGYGGNWNLSFSSNFTALFMIVSLCYFLYPSKENSLAEIDPFTIRFFAFGAGLLFLFAALWEVNLHTFIKPRYILHNVREIVTNFFFTFSLPISFAIGVEYFLFKDVDSYGKRVLHFLSWKRSLFPDTKFFVVIYLFTLGLILYHGIWGLQHQVANFAQHPTFSREPLSVGYLFSQHWFEHMLDYLFICCLSLGLQKTIPATFPQLKK